MRERDPVIAYVALGANLGDAVHALLDAFAAIARIPHTQLLQRSPLYRTAPVDSSGPDYVNAAAEISTRLTAPELLDALQGIETAAGRERPYRNAPRTLDLDLLLYGSARIESERLAVPHPRMHERAFVLVPLARIAPELVIPGLTRDPWMPDRVRHDNQGALPLKSLPLPRWTPIIEPSDHGNEGESK